MNPDCIVVSTYHRRFWEHSIIADQLWIIETILVSNPGTKILKTSMLASLATLMACSHNTPAPVFDLYSKNSSSSSIKPTSYDNSKTKAALSATSYTVKPGDTLFSIAWYHARDVEELAQINKIKNNIIYPGQTLSLEENDNQPFFDPDNLILALNEEVLNNKNQQRQTTKKSLSRNNLIKSKQVKLASIEKKSSNHQSETVIRSRTIKNSNLNWIWPTNGKVVSRFSNRLNSNRGLDIAANKGQAVRASAPGKVVYEGSGLKGYGNLVIIKHDDNYLSAYAHNDKVYVSENEVVKAGQRIADIGNSGTQSPKLHFEIRYKGKPVDPLNYLPNRKI